MPRTTSIVDRAKQTKATAATKRARLQEAGLGGRRTGKVSARTRVAQARRDRKSGPDRGTSAAAISAPESPADRKRTSARSTKKGTAPSKRRKGRATPMIEVRTTSSVPGSARLDAQVEKVVNAGLSRFSPRLTRIDVYLTDDNAAKRGADDKRCRLEARPTSHRAVSVSATSDTVERALASAVGKMQRKLSSLVAKQARGVTKRPRPPWRRGAGRA